jgi:hypothetical protein
MNKKIFFTVTIIIMFIGGIGFGVSLASEAKKSFDIERIGPDQTREKVQSGEALLVCSYNDEKCEPLLMEGAMLRSALEAKLPSFPKNQEIIFYCG